MDDLTLGRLLIERGLVPRETVSRAWQACQGSPQLSLLGVLVENGALDRELARSLPGPGEAAAGSVERPAPVTTRSGPSPAPDGRRSAELPAGFELVRELGRGGMGVVLLARQIETGREVVIKRMLRSDDEEQRRRFVREARLLAQLRHAHVPRVHGLEVGEQPYYIMDVIAGEDLKSRVRRVLEETGRPLDGDAAIEIIQPICAALRHCHEQGVLHRDIKPANLLLEERPGGQAHPWLLDFGIARAEGPLEDSLAAPLTLTGQSLGTPEFMAPEQVEPESRASVGPPADVWGLAATLFYALTGRPPYRGANITEITTKMLKEAPPRLRELQPEAPAWLDRLLFEALERDPARRPSLEAFERALQERDATEVAAARRARRRRALVLAASGLLVLTLLAALAYELRRGPAPTVSFAVTPPELPDRPGTFVIRERRLTLVLKAGATPIASVRSRPKATVQRRLGDTIELTLPIEGRETEVLIAPISETGREGAIRRLTVVRDGEPPLASAIELVDEGVRIRVDDPHAVGVFGDRVATPVDGALLWSPALDQPSSRVLLRDLAGNETDITAQLPLRVLGPRGAPPIDRILREGVVRRLHLLPGRYEVDRFKLEGSFAVVGAGADEVALVSRERGAAFELTEPGSSLRLSGLTLRPAKPGDDRAGWFRGALLQSGRLVIEDCGFEDYTEAGVEVSASPASRTSPPQLELRNVTLKRAGGCQLRIAAGRAALTDIRLLDPGASFKRGGNIPAVEITGQARVSMTRLRAEHIRSGFLHMSDQLDAAYDGPLPPWDPSARPARSLEIRELHLKATTNYGVAIAGSGSVARIENSRLSATTERGLLANRGAKLTLVNTTVEDCGTSAVSAFLTAQVRLEDCKVRSGLALALNSYRGGVIEAVECELETLDRKLIFCHHAPRISLQRCRLSGPRTLVEVAPVPGGAALIDGQGLTLTSEGPPHFIIYPSGQVRLRDSKPDSRASRPRASRKSRGRGDSTWTEPSRSRAHEPATAPIRCAPEPLTRGDAMAHDDRTDEAPPTEDAKSGRETVGEANSGCFGCFVLVLVLSFAAFGFGGWLYVEGHKQLKWPRIEGEIAGSTFNKSRSNNRVSWSLILYYNYEVDGKLHSGEYSESLQTEAGLQRRLREHPKGRAFPVHYNPENPEVSSVKPGEMVQASPLFALLGVALLGFAGFLHWVNQSPQVAAENSAGEDPPSEDPT